MDSIPIKTSSEVSTMFNQTVQSTKDSKQKKDSRGKVSQLSRYSDTMHRINTAAVQKRVATPINVTTKNRLKGRLGSLCYDEAEYSSMNSPQSRFKLDIEQMKAKGLNTQAQTQIEARKSSTVAIDLSKPLNLGK